MIIPYQAVAVKPFFISAFASFRLRQYRPTESVTAIFPKSRRKTVKTLFIPTFPLPFGSHRKE